MNQVKALVNKVVVHEKTPLVLTVVSCVGVVATAVLTAQAAPKAHRILEDEKAERMEDKLPILDQVKLTWKTYLPAVSVGVATIGTIVTMNRVTDRNIALLTAGATLATNTLRDYQQHVLEEIGAEKDSKIRDRMAKSAVARAEVPEAERDFVFTDNNILCFDALSGRYFEHNIEKIRAIENDLNREILSEMTLPLNSFYTALGIDEIEIGDILGWNIDNMIDIHFSSQLTKDKKPALVISHINMPRADFTTHIR